MTLENFTRGQASPPDILIQLFESLQSDDGANQEKSQQQLAVKLCRQQVTPCTLLLMAGLKHQNIYALEWH